MGFQRQKKEVTGDMGTNGRVGTETFRFLNRDAIKYIAMFTMLLNHIANIFLEPGTLIFIILVDIGYFTAPVMCYFLAEGYRYTRSRKKYALRLAVFALLSEIPFCLAFSEMYTGEKIISFCGFNMIFTLFLCFCILLVMDNVKRVLLRSVLITGLFILSLFSDWALIAPLFTVLFARAGSDEKAVRNAYLTGAGVFALMNFTPGTGAAGIWNGLARALMSAAGILAAGVVITRLYNGRRMERGKNFSKWFFYWFYPAHLLLMGVIRICIIR